MSKNEVYTIADNDNHYFGIRFKDKPFSAVVMLEDKEKAEHEASLRDGHVITLIKKPKKVELSKAEAAIVTLAQADVNPATVIMTMRSAYMSQDKLMNAYVNGFSIKEEKKEVPIDGLMTTDGEQQYLTKKDGHWFASRKDSNLKQKFTDEELSHAPVWVTAMLDDLADLQ